MYICYVMMIRKSNDIQIASFACDSMKEAYERLETYRRNNPNESFYLKVYN